MLLEKVRVVSMIAAQKVTATVLRSRSYREKAHRLRLDSVAVLSIVKNITEIESLLVRPLAQAIKVYNATSRTVRAIPHGNNLISNQKSTKNTWVNSRVFRYRNTDNNIQKNSGTCQATSKHTEVTSNDNKLEGHIDSEFVQISNNTNKDMVTDADNPSPFNSIPHIASNEKGGVSMLNHCEDNGLVGDTSGNEYKMLFDITNSDDDKYLNSVIFNDQDRVVNNNSCVAYDRWCHQSKFKFDFIPLTDPIMPAKGKKLGKKLTDPIKIHKEVKKYDLPNYLGALIPIESQLNIQAWEDSLNGHWDTHLLECLKFGFPLGFNRMT